MTWSTIAISAPEKSPRSGSRRAMNALLSWPALDGDVTVPNHGFALGDKLARGGSVFEGKVLGTSDGGPEGSIG